MRNVPRNGVIFRFNSYADGATVLADDPDVVIIATGGLPHTEVLPDGDDLVVSAWDILSGDAKPGENVLVYDDAGDHAGLQAAETISETGAKVEIITPDRAFAPEAMAMDLIPYMRSLQKFGAAFTVTWHLLCARRDGTNCLPSWGATTANSPKTVRSIRSSSTTARGRWTMSTWSSSRDGRIWVKSITRPCSRGGRKPLPQIRKGEFQLFRIGDAVASRNTHAAILDALRLVKDL